MRTRPRLGIPVTYPFSVRYLLHTGLIRRLSEVTDPVLLLAWEDADLTRQLEAEGAEVRSLPRGEVGPEYLRRRQAVELLFQHRLASPTTAIDWRRKDSRFGPVVRFRRRLARAIHGVSGRLPGGPDGVLADEARALLSDTDVAAVHGALRSLRLDALLSVTPYHGQEELLLRAGAREGLPLLTSIISFDNPTTRSWMSVTFDRYLVWNAHNRDELVRAYPEIDPALVRITGAPQMDFYANPRWCWSEEAWRVALGLPEDRPVILFGAGPSALVPHEPDVLAIIDEAIGSGRIPGRPVVVLRRHPMAPQTTWAPVLSRCGHVISDEPWPVTTGALTTSSPRVADIERMVSALAHSDVHVSTSSTMTVDGAWFDRPQIGPAFGGERSRVGDRAVRDLYRREHWLPIARSGGMSISPDPGSLVHDIGRGLSHPEERADGRRRVLEEIVTFTDGRATERVAAGIADALGVAAPAAGPPGAPHPGEDAAVEPR